MTKKDLALLQTLAPFSASGNHIYDKWNCIALSSEDLFIHDHVTKIGREDNNDYTKRLLDITTKVLNEAAGISAE